MAKRTKRDLSELRERDFWPTPFKPCVERLLPHLPEGPFKFIEPCAGDYQLVGHIEHHSQGRAIWACDIKPRHSSVVEQDAAELDRSEVIHGFYPDLIITNPPWKWEWLVPIIKACTRIAPTWLLLPADYMHNERVAPYMLRCEHIVSIGRVKWIAGSDGSGYENVAWYLFHNHITAGTLFTPRPGK